MHGGTDDAGDAAGASRANHLGGSTLSSSSSGQPVQVSMKVAVSATPVPMRSGVHNEALRATPLDSKYVAKRKERATKVIQEYFKNNLSPEHQCKKENCKGGFNHCCSMCKLIKGITRNSVLKATVGERIDEFAVGVLFGGCALKPPINEETNMTALEKLIEKHKAHPPLKQDVDNFDNMFEQPIPHDSCPDNMYRSSITRHALWEVRHERPDIVPEQLTTALLGTIKDMLARDDNMLIKENLYIMRGAEAPHVSFLDMENGFARVQWNPRLRGVTEGPVDAVYISELWVVFSD